ncbi:MAG: hypothetical protein MJY91_08835 [Bacteroidales bacterium]|nr:hypothetical protein [Bacteroidales bacterium]
MKKFLLFCALLAGAAILVVRLDFSPVQWAGIFCGLLFLRLLKVIFLPDVDEFDDFFSGFLDAFSGGMGFWEQLGMNISSDYLQGSTWYLIYKWGVTIAGVISLIFLIFKGIGWLFGQIVFWIVIGSIVLAIVVFFIVRAIIRHVKNKRIKAKRLVLEQYRNECNDLVGHIVNDCNVPMPLDAISAENREYAEDLYCQIRTLNESLKTAGTADLLTLKRKIADKKLEMFYKVSMAAQSKNLLNSDDKYRKKFFTLVDKYVDAGDYDSLRAISNDCSAAYGKSLSVLKKDKALLEDNTMQDYIDELEETKGIDTSMAFGFFTDRRKLSAKADILQNLLNSAMNETAELNKIRSEVNHILEDQRVAAYESLYLGVELINIIRDNAGGKNLSKVDDIVEMNIDISGVDVSCNVPDTDFAGLAVDKATSMLDRFFNDENYQAQWLENPKGTILAESVDFVADCINRRNAEIDANNDIIRKCAERIPILVDAYTEGQVKLLRAIELIKSLIEANKAFDKIYSPLHKKIFVDRDVASVSLMDQKYLVSAMKEFNKIASSQL